MEIGLTRRNQRRLFGTRATFLTTLLQECLSDFFTNRKVSARFFMCFHLKIVANFNDIGGSGIWHRYFIVSFLEGAGKL